MNYELRTIFVGGTFDGLHRGHQAVLDAAFKAGDKVTIGLTSNNFIKKYKSPPNFPYFPNPPNNFNRRKQVLLSWLDSQGYLSRFAILPIDDPYEPASSADYDALIVTQDNIERGREINTRRLARGLPPVKLIEVPIIPAEDGRPISSTRIRSGEVDTAGRLIMPESLRSLLQKPLGKVLTSSQSVQNSLRNLSTLSDVSDLVVSVGDMSTQTLLDAGFKPHLCIIDQHLCRQPVDTLKSFGNPNTYTLHRLTSGPGYISADSINLIKHLLQVPNLQKPIEMSLRRALPPVVILVTGEEDLLTLPAVIYAPLGSVVYYGQPAWLSAALPAGKSGLVEVKVNQRSRARALTLLQQFHGFTANTT